MLPFRNTLCHESVNEWIHNPQSMQMWCQPPRCGVGVWGRVHRGKNRATRKWLILLSFPVGTAPAYTICMTPGNVPRVSHGEGNDYEHDRDSDYQTSSQYDKGRAK